MVFPTRASAEIARRSFEPSWNLQEIHWLTMEDFKRVLLAKDTPVMEDEKRLLCLWQILSAEDKDFFHLAQYQDLVEWGGNFFRFLEEFREANRPIEDLVNLSQDPLLYIRAWQEEHLKRIHGIVSDYRSFVEKLGFTDPIFTDLTQQIYIPWEGYRIVFVNQFYFSKLEQNLIALCEASLAEVILLNHEVKHTESSLQKPEFDPRKSNMLEGLKERLKIYECESEEQAAWAFLALHKPRKNSAIIDSSFSQKAYSALFPPEMVGSPYRLEISHSLLFRFLSLLLELAQSQKGSAGYVPLSIISRYCLDEDVCAIILKNWNSTGQNMLNREIFKLADTAVIVLDIHPAQQFTDFESKAFAYPHLFALCKELFSIVEKILQIRRIADLSELFTNELEPKKLCSQDELNKTDILEQFWKALANFSAIESLNVVRDWSLIFDEPGIGIFDLWISFLKPVTLAYASRESYGERWEITNLLDSRNRSFDAVAVLQVVEGVLPQSPGSVWLLNENQRAKLGLISYDTIRNWERYYFFRLLLTGGDSTLFTYRNQAQNRVPSSFIGELEQILEISAQRLSIPIQALYESYKAPVEPELKEKIDTDKEFRVSVDEAFCTLPACPTSDFTKKAEICFNSYDVHTLLKNPFIWYIQSLRKIPDFKTELKETISPALFGTLMHAWFAEVLGKTSSRHKAPESLATVFTDDKRLRKILSSITHSPDFYYKIPKNYNEEFLNSIISDCLVASLKEFYYRFLLPYLDNTSFELIPEETRPEDEKYYKLLVEREYAGITYKLKIRGRADLRITSPQKFFIIDFKTGAADAAQLIFYEWFYYLIDNPERADRMESYFWMILDRRLNLKDRVREKKRISFADDIWEQIQSCMENGYRIGARGDNRRMGANITRSDLLVEREQQ
jgi:hypothetical protein